MAKKQFANISNAELAAKGVVALADKPNVAASYGVGGLSPTQLKLWFDKLGNLMASKINTLQTALSDEGQDYVGIDNLGDTIECLKDLTATFLNGSFATILLAYESAVAMGDTDNLKTLQVIINNKAQLIADLDEALAAYKTLIKSNAGAAEVGVSDSYNGSGKKLSNIVADIANCTLSTKLTLAVYGFATATKTMSSNKTLKGFADDVADALQGDIGSGLLEKIAARYTKTETDALLLAKVDKTTYESAQNTQDGRLTSLETRATDVEGNIGEMSNITPIAADIALAIKSLNEDIDSLQLGVIPRIIRGVVLWATPETLNASLIAELNAKVLLATGRRTPNNSDSVQVWDNAMPDAGKIYTYHYWSSAVIGSELDGWYLASIYMSPAITDIPSYILNVLPTSWSNTADSDGLYYITVPAITHGMGSDMSLYVDLRRKTEDGNFAPCNQFYVSSTGTVICYTDEKFEGKLIVRVGKAYYTTNTTNIVTVEMEQVNGLDDALDAKLNLNNGDTAETKVTFTDITGIAENLASGNKLKVIFGKIKNWFGRLGTLAFKSSIANVDVATDAAIAQSKISGLTDDLSDKAEASALAAHTGSTSNPHSVTKAQVGLGSVDNTADSAKPVSIAQQEALNAKVTASGGEIKDTVVTFSDATGTRTNLTSGDSTKNLFAKIKQWLAALDTLAFKSSVTASDITGSLTQNTSGKATTAGTADTANAVVDGCITNAKVASNAAITADKIDLTTLRNLLYPIGSIKMTTVNTNPSTYLGGTWAAWGAGRVPVGVDTTQTEFDGVEETGGEKVHTLTQNEMPSHSHGISVNPDLGGYGGSIQIATEGGNYVKYLPTSNSTSNKIALEAVLGSSNSYVTISPSGGGGSHTNLQPYITCYMWKRTA